MKKCFAGESAIRFVRSRSGRRRFSAHGWKIGAEFQSACVVAVDASPTIAARRSRPMATASRGEPKEKRT